MTTWFHRVSNSEEGRKLLLQERLLLETTQRINEFMEEQQVSKVDLARRLKVRPSFITKLLCGENNFTLRTLSDVYYHLGRSARLESDKLSWPASTLIDDLISTVCCTKPSSAEAPEKGALRFFDRRRFKRLAA